MQLRTAAALLATLSVSPLARSPHSRGSKQAREERDGGRRACLRPYIRPAAALPTHGKEGNQQRRLASQTAVRKAGRAPAPAALRVPSVLSLSLTLNRSCWHDAFLAGAPAATAAGRRRPRRRRRSFLCGVWCSRSGRGHGRRGLPFAVTRLRRHTARFKFFRIRTDGAQGNQVWSIDT